MSSLTRAQFDELEKRFQRGEADEADLQLLEPYRVRRAVLLASGFGSRMVPVTLNTPKPLVRVNGRRIIDSLLDALVAAGIDEIYVVVGYLAEQFELLRNDYPQVKLIHNPLYDVTNNISSAVAAARHFRNAYVFESDLLLRSPQLISRYSYDSWYLGVPVDRTDDWCFVTQDGEVRGLQKGGEACHHMFGVSHWTNEDGARLERDLREAFACDENRQLFWDEIPCNLRREGYRITVRPCAFDDIAEIDSFAELQQIDPAYRISQ
ncbi:phosphocholine cytidylyltransferase family protein [Eggerthellaceae bacterium zg-1084]|uniref:NTP transferase domain-containing protein n=1 Tax=Berryella wangjianweii TaxID=2734634 RepID=UPI001555BA6E|nr:phosphocholine cytidylyltransferase family protein [Berryella wangjianweii]NPD31311.1 phosphocholine cytidylyltransferase family protein [Berryella wangjianweii]